jgi:hypothetical protein
MGESKRGKTSGGQRDKTPVYTFVDVGIPKQGLSIWGYRNPGNAKQRAREHYEGQLAAIHAALEAIDQNRVRVVYTRGGEQISEVAAMRTHAKVSGVSAAAKTPDA